MKKSKTNMITFGDVVYYVDLKAIDKLVSGEKSFQAQMLTEKETITTLDASGNTISVVTSERAFPKSKEIDGSKYDLIRFLLETVIDYNDELDDAMGAEFALDKASLSFKIAFNTLCECGVLKEVGA